MTRSRFCEIGSSRPFTTGFSLIEMVVTLALLALVAALVAPGVSRALRRDGERQRMVELVATFADQRVESMRRMQGCTLRLDVRPGGLAVVRQEDGEVASEWEAFGPVLAGISGADSVRTVGFDAFGRTRTRRMEFEGAPPARTMWAIEFDPLSGAPSLRTRARKEQEW